MIVKALEQGFDKVLGKLDEQHKEQKTILQEGKSKGRIGLGFYCDDKDHWANKCPEKT